MLKKKKNRITCKFLLQNMPNKIEIKESKWRGHDSQPISHIAIDILLDLNLWQSEILLVFRIEVTCTLTSAFEIIEMSQLLLQTLRNSGKIMK